VILLLLNVLFNMTIILSVIGLFYGIGIARNKTNNKKRAAILTWLMVVPGIAFCFAAPIGAVIIMPDFMALEAIEKIIAAAYFIGVLSLEVAIILCFDPCHGY
jgi:hypothetical protein